MSTDRWILEFTTDHGHHQLFYDDYDKAMSEARKYSEAADVSVYKVCEVAFFSRRLNADAGQRS